MHSFQFTNYINQFQVNQSSKWLVDLENDENIQKFNLEMGTNVWCTNLTQGANNAACSIVPDSAVFNLENLNRPSQFDANVFHECEPDKQFPDRNDKDSNVTLHLRLQTLNINVDERNSTNSFCHIPNTKPQIDLMLN